MPDKRLTTPGASDVPGASMEGKPPLNLAENAFLGALSEQAETEKRELLRGPLLNVLRQVLAVRLDEADTETHRIITGSTRPPSRRQSTTLDHRSLDKVIEAKDRLSSGNPELPRTPRGRKKS